MNVSMNPGDDPLGLRELPEPQPEPGRIEQDWAAVSSALDARLRLRRRALTGGLAAAASIALAVALMLALVGLPRPETATPETLGPATAQTAAEDSAPGTNPEQSPAEASDAEALMAMSQDAERQLRLLRKQVGAMPSQAVVYQVELQDLIGQIDDALGMSPDSPELWGQRLSLQLDLMKLYSNQLRRDHADLASL